MSEILGVLFAILVGTLVIPKFADFQRTSNDNTRAAITAQQQKQLYTASTTYIQQNAVAVQGVATPTVPATITVAMLQAAGVDLLPASFSAVNPYGQTWQIQVLEPTANNLQALVFATGGTAIQDKQAGKIAAIVGASGGLIPLNDSGIYAGGAANAVGTASGWTIPTANYTTITGGTPAALLTFNNGQMTSNYLYRNAVPGQPQLNTMNTPLLMGAGTVQVTSGACTAADLGKLARDAGGKVLMCDGVAWKTQGSAFWQDPVATYAALPACSGANAAQTRIVSTPTLGAGPRAYTCSGATWTALTLDDNGNMSIPGTVTAGKLQVNDVVVETAACAPNGLVAKDSTGFLLSCQTGSWKKAVKAPNAYRYMFTSSQAWTVPIGVASAFVTMAGGGGSGYGWRVISSYTTGHSGGYVFSQPINLIPGEVLQITVGRGGVSFPTIQSSTPIPGYPAYRVYTNPPGDDGLSGYPGESSILTSPSLGTLLRCDGGSGASAGRIDGYGGGKVAGNYDGATNYSGTSPIIAPNRVAAGPYANSGWAGACGPASYGVGNGGTNSYNVISGYYSGGATPFGYGSGGGVGITGCYVTTTFIGTCINPYPGRDGVVFIDVLY